MSDEFGPSFITLTDEEGNDIELEYVDALEYNGQTYMAFFPAVPDESEDEGEEKDEMLFREKDEDPEEMGLVILKSITENGEELLSTLDSDEELNRVYELFMEQMMEDGEEKH